MVATRSPLSRLVARISRLLARGKRVYGELEYAQRRLFELRTGVSPRPTPPRVSLEDLEALYELEYPGEADREVRP